jgi:hypothetical protein
MMLVDVGCVKSERNQQEQRVRSSTRDLLQTMHNWMEDFGLVISYIECVETLIATLMLH